MESTGQYYNPSLMVVKAGQTVTCINHDFVPHTATDLPFFDTGPVQPGHEYKLTLYRAGTFNYFCEVHPFMKGTIVLGR
jgi:plastocyanin